MARSPTNLTELPIVPTLVRLAVPIVLANVLQTIYQLIDTFWVGRLGADAVAAVSLSFPVIFLLISVGGGLSIAGTILVGHYEGRRDRERVNHVAAQTVLLVGIISVVLSALGLVASPWIVHWMGASEAVQHEAVDYLQISFLGLVFVFLYYVYQSLMRGVGDVRTPVFIVLGTVVLNGVLDPLFIFGWGPVPALGVAGAALATVIAQGVAALVGLGLLFSGRFGISLRGQRFRFDVPLARRMLRIGLPASVEQSTLALGLSMMTFLVTGFGSVVLASYGIGTRLFSFALIPALGLSMATSTVVAQNVGAQRIDRAQQVARLSGMVGFAALSLVGLACLLFADGLVAFFVPDDPAVVAMGADFLRIMAPTFGFVGIQQVLNGVFRGAGHTFISMVLAIVTLWVLRFPLAYALAERTTLGPTGIWWAFPISNVIAALAALGWYARGSWKRTTVTEEDELERQVLELARVEEGIE